ncbi:MAG: hypothetical protein ABL903_05780 [Methylococcales bacterium]
MNYKFSLLSVCLIIFCLEATAGGIDDVGPIKYDGGKIPCNRDTGPEIKQLQQYKAPSDRFIIEDSIKLSEISAWPQDRSHGCDLIDVVKKKIKVKTEYGEVEIPVVSQFSLYAHADCGSGVDRNSGGKNASVECSVFYQTQKYSNQ